MIALKVIVIMYLAMWLLNVIESCRLFYYIEGNLTLIYVIYTLIRQLFRPYMNFVGLCKSLQDWDWMFDVIEKDENGTVHVKHSDNIDEKDN